MKKFTASNLISYFLIFILIIFSIFWQGAEVPDFKNAPRYTTVGKYICPRSVGYGGGIINEIEYYNHWSKGFGLWQSKGSCYPPHSGQVLEMEWINFQGKRIMMSLKDKKGEIFYNFESFYFQNAQSMKLVYLIKLLSLLISIFIYIYFISNKGIKK